MHRICLARLRRQQQCCKVVLFGYEHNENTMNKIRIVPARKIVRCTVQKNASYCRSNKKHNVDKNKNVTKDFAYVISVVHVRADVQQQIHNLCVTFICRFQQRRPVVLKYETNINCWLNNAEQHRDRMFQKAAIFDTKYSVFIHTDDSLTLSTASTVA